MEQLLVVLVLIFHQQKQLFSWSCPLRHHGCFRCKSKTLLCSNEVSHRNKHGRQSKFTHGFFLIQEKKMIYSKRKMKSLPTSVLIFCWMRYIVREGWRQSSQARTNQCSQHILFLCKGTQSLMMQCCAFGGYLVQFYFSIISNSPSCRTLWMIYIGNI